MKKSILLTIFLLFFFNFKISFAQEKPKGITVFPSIAHIDLAQDPPQYELTYINNTNSEINLKLSVEDFTQLEDSYKVSFLDKKDAQNYKYSLSSWISFENPNLDLNPGETKSVKVFIDKDRITKGGHYASILAEIDQPENNKQVNVKAVLSSLLFVRASTGKEIEDGKINLFSQSRDFFDFPDSFILRFQNSGNVNVIPYGLIQVYDPFGNLIAKGEVNENSLDTLPESIRAYLIPIKSYQKVLLPGFYTAQISIHYGKTNQKLFAKTKFFSQGSFNFLLISGVIFAIFFLLLYYKKNRKNERNYQ